MKQIQLTKTAKPAPKPETDRRTPGGKTLPW